MSNDNNSSHVRRTCLVTLPETVIEGESDLEEEQKRSTYAMTTKTKMDTSESSSSNSKNISSSNNSDNTSSAAVLSDSNIKDPQRRICVVTTAALPWRTGTAVNPLLRALYLTRGRKQHFVTLIIPWCSDPNDRKLTLGDEYDFTTSNEQEQWIRDFCRTRANCSGT